MSDHPTDDKSGSVPKLKSKRGRKKRGRGPAKDKVQAIPYSAGVKEIQVTILKTAIDALESEALSQSRGARFGKITAADVVATLAFNMGVGPTIEKDKEERVTVTMVIPVAALEQLESVANRNQVGIERIIEELGVTLDDTGAKRKSRLDGIA